MSVCVQCVADRRSRGHGGSLPVLQSCHRLHVEVPISSHALPFEVGARITCRVRRRGLLSTRTNKAPVSEKLDFGARQAEAGHRTCGLGVKTCRTSGSSDPKEALVLCKQQHVRLACFKEPL